MSLGIRTRQGVRAVIPALALLLVPLAFSAFPGASAAGRTPTSTSLAVAGGANYGDPLTLTATVTSASGTPTGTVTFSADGGGVIASGVKVDSVGHASVTSADIGLTSYHADFTGSAGFANSSGAALHLTNLAPIVLKPIASVLTISRSVPFRFTMVASGIATRLDGTPISGERVFFTIQGKAPSPFGPGGTAIGCTSVTNAQGYASCEGVQGRTVAVVALLGGGFYMTHDADMQYAFGTARGKLIVVGGP